MSIHVSRRMTRRYPITLGRLIGLCRRAQVWKGIQLGHQRSDTTRTYLENDHHTPLNGFQRLAHFSFSHVHDIKGLFMYPKMSLSRYSEA